MSYEKPGQTRDGILPSVFLFQIAAIEKGASKTTPRHRPSRTVLRNYQLMKEPGPDVQHLVLGKLRELLVGERLSRELCKDLARHRRSQKLT